jgi:hypothetical protein
MANVYAAEKAEILHNFLIMLETTKTNTKKTMTMNMVKWYL